MATRIPASFVADNDYALGRIVEYLSHSPWWKEMAVFVTEDDAQGGRDHIDSHRTVLMGWGRIVSPNYVLHRNTSFPGLLKTIFRILGIAPLNLYDAAATDLSDAFTATPISALTRSSPPTRGCLSRRMRANRSTRKRPAHRWTVRRYPRILRVYARLASRSSRSLAGWRWCGFPRSASASKRSNSHAGTSL